MTNEQRKVLHAKVWAALENVKSIGLGLKTYGVERIPFSIDSAESTAKKLEEALKLIEKI